MSKQTETARKDAQKSGCARCADEKKITLVIDGEWYQNLKRVADTMNTVSWCHGNTPETVFKEFVLWSLDCTLGSVMELCTLIESSIDTGFEGKNEKKHRARLAELRAAFKCL